MTTPLRRTVLGSLAVFCALAAAGCGADPAVPAAVQPAAGSPAPSPSAAAASSVADRCRQAVRSLNTYASVAAEHPINILPGATNPPETIEPVQQAAGRAAAELRGVADGMTEESVLTHLQESIKLLDASAAGKFGSDQGFLPVGPLIRACGAAAPELAEGKGLEFNLDTE